MSTASQHRRASGRRGSAYVFVLGVCLIVTVLAMGALNVTNVSAKSISAGNDWETAGTLAFSATEHAVSVLNTAAAASPAGWRSAYTSGQTAFSQALGRGTMSWVLKDETDGNLSADYLRPVRVYGIGTVGSVTRVYSVQIVPGGSPLDVLRTALHSGNSVQLTGSTQAANGPISSNTSVKLSGTVKGSIEAPSTSGSASGTQTITTPAPVKTMPSATVYTQLLSSATAIPYSALSGGKMENALLSPAVNPWGAANANGIYSLVVPTNGTVTIDNCRIVGTLLIGGTNVNVNVQGPVEWEDGPAAGPILVISSIGAKVTIAGSPSWLSEASTGVNFNPASTPYAGTSNTTTTDDFPPQFRGIVHVIAGSSGSVELKANTYTVGTFIADCPLKTSGQSTLVQDPTIYASPPYGYAVGDALAEVPGSWRWDTLP